MSAARSGSRYVRAQASSSGPPVIPASTKPTNRGQATVCSVDLRRGGERVVVRLGGGGRLGADHSDPAGPGSRHRPPGRRQDHFDHRHGVPLPGVAEHRGAGGVAGDDQHLDALVDQMVEALQGVLADAGDRLVAVRRPGRVPQIHDVLVRQLVDHRPGHGESAESGVEDADRRLGVGHHGRSAYASR